MNLAQIESAPIDLGLLDDVVVDVTWAGIGRSRFAALNEV